MRFKDNARLHTLLILVACMLVTATGIYQRPEQVEMWLWLNGVSFGLYLASSLFLPKE